MAGPYRSFDGRDLPAAARDSYGRLLALFRNCVKVHPSPSGLAFFPLSVCQRCTTTSTYFGSSSRPQQTRSVNSAAASVVPLPRNGSYTSWPRFVWFRIGHEIDWLLAGISFVNRK